MTTMLTAEAVQTLTIQKSVFIGAPLAISWAAIFEEMGPGSVLPDGKPFPMKIEQWPGGRWFRDLGNNTGHLWGHVQVIKPPALLEICGPMAMSYPAYNFIQYRLKEEGTGTRLTLNHRAMGLIPPEHVEEMPKGWEHGIGRVRELAEKRARK